MSTPGCARERTRASMSTITNLSEPERGNLRSAQQERGGAFDALTLLCRWWLRYAVRSESAPGRLPRAVVVVRVERRRRPRSACCATLGSARLVEVEMPSATSSEDESTCKVQPPSEGAGVMDGCTTSIV